ncbi:MAG: hypothetical protein AAGA75_00105 [Cyanobacteria bacterium P01_E01_bin.6]
MTSRKPQRRNFSGMSYREVQRSNSRRREQLPKQRRVWLKKNGYKNVGWENVIHLYQKINELIAESDDEPTLEELFLQADRIGKKYQTSEELESFKQQMTAEVNAISTIIDQQFPETDVEVIDYRQSSNARMKNKFSREKYN